MKYSQAIIVAAIASAAVVSAAPSVAAPPMAAAEPTAAAVSTPEAASNTPAEQSPLAAPSGLPKKAEHHHRKGKGLKHHRHRKNGRNSKVHRNKATAGHVTPAVNKPAAIPAAAPAEAPATPSTPAANAARDFYDEEDLFARALADLDLEELEARGIFNTLGKVIKHPKKPLFRFKKGPSIFDPAIVTNWPPPPPAERDFDESEYLDARELKEVEELMARGKLGSIVRKVRNGMRGHGTDAARTAMNVASTFAPQQQQQPEQRDFDDELEMRDFDFEMNELD